MKPCFEEQEIRFREITRDAHHQVLSTTITSWKLGLGSVISLIVDGWDIGMEVDNRPCRTPPVSKGKLGLGIRSRPLDLMWAVVGWEAKMLCMAGKIKRGPVAPP